MNSMNAATLSAHGPGSRWSWRKVGSTAGLVGVVLLAGCSTRSVSVPAPVEDRTGGKMADVKPLPGAENAGKPGYFTVRPGDTLYRIALESGQSPRDVQAWNNLSNPNLIEVGQVLKAQIDVCAIDRRFIFTVVDARRVNVRPQHACFVQVDFGSVKATAIVEYGDHILQRIVCF